MKDVLPQVEAMDDGENRIDAIHHHEAEPNQRLRLDHQQKHKCGSPESNTDTSHITRKAASLFPVVKEQEHR